MIRINLLKSPVRKRPGIKINPRVITTILGIVGVILVGTGGWFGVRYYLAHKPAPVAKKPTVETAPTNFTPSTFVKTRSVEDVVRDVQDLREKQVQSGIIDVPYEQLSFFEKVNYEQLFARQACEMMVRDVPEQIGLRSLELDNFQTIYAMGLGSSRDIIQEMLANLKVEKVDILKPPYSSITDNAGGGYKFAVTCKAEWGLNLTDPFVDITLAQIPQKTDLTQLVERFRRIATENGVTITGDIRQADIVKTGAFYQFAYSVNGSSSFVNIIQFLKALYDARMPCAFKRLSLSAKTKSNIGIEATVLFTTRE